MGSGGGEALGWLVLFVVVCFGDPLILNPPFALPKKGSKGLERFRGLKHCLGYVRDGARFKIGLQGWHFGRTSIRFPSPTELCKAET